MSRPTRDIRPLGAKTPFKHSSYVPRHLGSQAAMTSRLDLSNSLGGMSVSGRLFAETPSNRATFASSSNLTPRNSILLSQTIDEDQEVTVTSRGFLLEDDPGLAACRHLYEEFLEELRAQSSQHNIFALVARYERISLEVVAVLWKFINGAAPVHGKLQRTAEMLALMTSEQQTWRLVSSLYQDRVDSELLAGDITKDTTIPGEVGGVAHSSEKELTDNLFTQDAALRQAQLVVDWLEFCAEKQLESYYNKVEFSVDRMGAWENTLHILKQKKEANNPLFSRNLVDQLDPDAPLRQGKRLSDLDEEDDSRLLSYIFCCLRAGHIDEAYKVCAKVGQLWRAATLEGWRLYHDPNVRQLGPGGTVQPVVGNPYRDIWKRSCWSLSEDENISPVERAIYASLSGNLKQLLPLCSSSWHDHLWAYFKCLVDQRVENNIQLMFNGPRPLLPPALGYLDKQLTYEGIFAEIEASSVEIIRQQSQYKFNQIQKYLIMDNVQGLLEAMSSWCGDDNMRPHPHLLRFMAHLVLFLKNLGCVTSKEELCDRVLQTYIRLLIDDRHTELVATYVARLPAALQPAWYAKFLEGIHETADRRRCLELAKDSNLDIPVITKLVVENIREIDCDELLLAETVQPLEGNTTEDDRVKIRAIEWLTFDRALRSEALHQCNAIARVFLIRRKLSACRETLEQLPIDTIDVIVKNWHAKAGDIELPAADSNAIRESLCIKTYLDAEDSFSDWFKHYHNARPSAPTSSLGANFTERVAFEHLEQQYRSELDRWQHSLNFQTRVTVKKMYNVLLFIDGGWMVDQCSAQDVDEEAETVRAHEMRTLREICLPALCILLHKVLHTTKQYKECLQLADHIASEQHRLYSVFRPAQLRQFLEKLRESSIALLDAGQDPLGYPLNDP